MSGRRQHRDTAEAVTAALIAGVLIAVILSAIF